MEHNSSASVTQPNWTERIKNLDAKPKIIAAVGAFCLAAAGVFVSCHSQEGQAKEAILDAYTMTGDPSGNLYVQLCDGPNLVTAVLKPDDAQDGSWSEANDVYYDAPGCDQFGEQKNPDSVYDGFTDYDKDYNQPPKFRTICLRKEDFPAEAQPGQAYYTIQYDRQPDPTSLDDEYPSPGFIFVAGSNKSVICDDKDDTNTVRSS